MFPTNFCLRRTLLSCNNVLSSRGIKSNLGLLFFEPKIQNILQNLSTPALENAFPARKTGERLKPPTYKFFTDMELREEFKEYENRAKKWLQMPPVLDPRPENESIISHDSALDGFDHEGSSFIFTDITYGIKDEDRVIIVREPNGTIKHANWEQRHRMTETYVPRQGREHIAPPMFDGEHLESLLERKEYQFILDRACAQFEPDDPEYNRVTTTTYNRVAKERDYRMLFGTRHFGSMVFYLVFYKQIDALLLHSLQNDKLNDAVSLVHLYHMVHPDAASVDAAVVDDDGLIRAFIAKDASRPGVLELALQTCLERQQEKKLATEIVEKAHGVHG